MFPRFPLLNGFLIDFAMRDRPLEELVSSIWIRRDSALIFSSPMPFRRIMTKQPSFINVRDLAVLVAGAPLLLLLIFSAIDVSFARLSHSNHLDKSTGLVSETAPNSVK